MPTSSSFEAPNAIPDASTAISRTLSSFLYILSGEPYDDAEFDGRSDYEAFINNNIPAGGLFTGAEVPKTAEQQSIWGGTVGAQFDPCYHLACDTFANVNDHALNTNADAIAFAMLTYAFSTESVNGVAGRNVPGSRLKLCLRQQVRKGRSSPRTAKHDTREGLGTRHCRRAVNRRQCR